MIRKLYTVFLVLFTWHEIEEYHVLLPWVAKNRALLPLCLKKDALSERRFMVIAAEEFFLIVLLGIFSKPIWQIGAIVAYGIHLIVHSIHMIYALFCKAPLKLFSAPLQLLIFVGMLSSNRTKKRVGLFKSGAVMSAAMVTNLVVLHGLFNRVSRHRSSFHI